MWEIFKSLLYAVLSTKGANKTNNIIINSFSIQLQIDTGNEFGLIFLKFK